MMDMNKGLRLIKGIIPPIVTPLTPTEDVDEQGVRAMVEHCIASGLHAIFVAGSNGEAMSITQMERNRLIGMAVDQAKSRVPVLCGVMDASTRKVIDNIKAMEQTGGTIAVITPAFYVRNSCQHEIVTHFERIALNTDARLMIYNIPAFTSVNILPETVAEIAQIDNVIGLKDSSGNFVQFQKCLQQRKHAGFQIYQGVTDMAGASLLIGADGIIPVLAPLFPDLFLGIYKAAVGGDIAGTMIYQELIGETSRILSMGRNAVSAAKFAVSLLGFSSKTVTAPVEPLTDSEEKSIREYVAQLHEKLNSLK